MKPTTIPCNYDAIPTELQALLIWLLWHYEIINGRWTKVPLIADESRRKAASDKPKTWRSFADAKRFAELASGIGLCLTENYCGFDLDCCRDLESGLIAPWAERIVEILNSYTEVSPSGTGLRIIVKLMRELPQGRRLRGGKERSGWEIAVYDKTSPRYLAMTGVVVDGRDTIRLCDPQEFYPEFEIGGLDPEPTKVNGKANGRSNGHSGYQDKRARLIRGEWEGLYSSQSEADAALVWFLADEYNDDPELIDSAFRSSGLMRPKWDELRQGGTYGSITIAHCLEKKGRRAGEELILGREGTPKACLANCLMILRQSPEWRGVLAYNEFSLYVTSKKSAPWQKTGGANWTDNDDTLLCEWLQHRGIIVKTHVASEAAQTIAKENPYHPVRDYLNALVWDGVPRLERWWGPKIQLSLVPSGSAGSFPPWRENLGRGVRPTTRYCLRDRRVSENLLP
jgi:hypothetical protein